MFTLNLNALHEPEPMAVHSTTKERNGDPKFEVVPLLGKWLRVFPQTARDVSFLRMLEHRVDKFAPASGVGVLISTRSLPVRLGIALTP